MKKIIINHSPWQTRIALLRDGLLQNIYFSAHAQQHLERAYFKGVVSKVLPGIQTAFVDIGQDRAGFLHISEIDRELAIHKISKHTQFDETDASTATTEQSQSKRHRQKADIGTILKEGQQILVQVSKEPVYEKGAKLSTCFTLPGRFIVLMPNIPRMGVSKKIENREERTRLKDLVLSLLPEGMGAIIRTTSEGRSPTDIKKDIDYLLNTWTSIEKKMASADPKQKLYEDLDVSLQIVRDHLDDDVEEVVVDSAALQNEIYYFVKQIAPEHIAKIKIYQDTTPIFEQYGIEKQIEHALDKKVYLKSGGSLIIETTQAMTVVDVNTGRFIGKSNLEETILKTNMEAAQEVVRQLRLRNIGGLIVIDFIDMATGANKQKLFHFFEKTLREHDKFQSVVLKLSEFGLVEMTRKRSGKTLQQQLLENCTTCHGTGYLKSLQTEAYAILRNIKQELATKRVDREVAVHLNQRIFNYITSTEYIAVLDLEKEYNCKITLMSDSSLTMNQYKIGKK